MKFDRLYYFESAARNESFTLAAKEYHVAPSAISQQIKVLEESLGFYLFNRSTNKKVTLTSSGEILYERVKEIISLYENAVEEAKLELKKRNNVLTIGVCETRFICCINNIIYRLKEKYSDIEIKLNMIEGSCCYSSLIDNSCDVLFSSKNISINDSRNNLEKKIISYGDMGILVDSSCYLANKEHIYLKDLLDSKSFIYTLDIYKNCLLEHLPELKYIIKTEQSINLLFASGYLNKGIILTTYDESKILNLKNMVFRKLVDSPIDDTYCMYYLRNNKNWILEELLNL